MAQSKQRGGRRKRVAASDAVPLKLIGSLEGALATRVSDHDDPVREAALDTAIEWMRKMRTTYVIALIPVFVKCATLYGEHGAGVSDSDRSG